MAFCGRVKDQFIEFKSFVLNIKDFSMVLLWFVLFSLAWPWKFFGSVEKAEDKVECRS